jgi:replicative DNA helicase
MQAAIRDSAERMVAEQQQAVRAAQSSLRQTPGWNELTQEEQSNQLGEIEAFVQPTAENIEGIAQLVNERYGLQDLTNRLRDEIGQLAEERQKKRLEAELERARREGGKTIKRKITISPKPSKSDIDELIRSLEKLRSEMGLYDDIDITIELQA